jgi:hypothetical protein
MSLFARPQSKSQCLLLTTISLLLPQGQQLYDCGVLGCASAQEQDRQFDGELDSTTRENLFNKCATTAAEGKTCIVEPVIWLATATLHYLYLQTRVY